MINYGTDSIPATRSGMAALNKQVEGFRVYTQGDREVLGVSFGANKREVIIPLTKSELPTEQRRLAIDRKASEQILKRVISKNIHYH